MKYKNIFFIASLCNLVGLYAEEGRWVNGLSFSESTITAQDEIVERHTLMGYHLKDREADVISDQDLYALLDKDYQTENHFDAKSTELKDEHVACHAKPVSCGQAVGDQKPEQSLWQRLFALLHWISQGK